MMEKEKKEGGESKTNVFPLFAVSGSASTGHSSSFTVPDQWLCNPSFTTDLSVIDAAVSSFHGQQTGPESDQGDDSDQQRTGEKPSSASYELLPENGEELEEEEKEVKEDPDSDSGREKLKQKKKSKKKHRRKRKRSRDEGEGFTSRKSSVRVWADFEIKPPKDYYFDTHGDRDNLVYGSLYKMDVPRYKPYLSTKPSGFDFRGLYHLSGRMSEFDRDGDVDVLDTKLKSDGRYWSAKYAAVERHRNFKHLHLVASKQPAVLSDEFIPLPDIELSLEVTDSSSTSKAFVFEESWEDEILRKTLEFNKLTREQPHDEKAWLDFAEFQDKVAKTQRQKAARLQTLEKKISILEKATELNPDNEDLLLYLLKAYQSRDTADVLIGRWEKVLMQHSGSYNLWKEYLHVVKGEFAKFKVSDMQKMYGHAIQALSAACNKRFRFTKMQNLHLLMLI
uniref:Protein NRDE2 homolog n=1 Tax=Rhizophora mucronata TaxID=61149 RepID=A0A2P2L8D0_RHIMU